MTQFEKHEWYTFTNGNFKKTFFCIDISGEYLLFDSKRGYSLAACRPATEEEIKIAKEDDKKS